MTNPVRYCHWLVLIVAVQACGGDGGTPPAGSQATGVFANRVIDYSPELPAGETIGQAFYDPASTLGEPGGTLDVTSLGDDKAGAGGSITVVFGQEDNNARHCIVDGIGADLAVYENPFAFSDSSGPVNFTEAAYVEVSQDDIVYFRFPRTFPPADPALVGNPAEFSNLAGINVGGDSFELAEIIIANSLDGTFKACYVRIVDAGLEVPDYDSDGELATNSLSGADIDAVEALNFEPAPDFAP